MDLAVLPERRPEWEEEFGKHYMVPPETSVALPKMIRAYDVFASYALYVSGGVFRKLLAPESGSWQASPQLVELCKTVQERAAMFSSLQKEPARVSAKVEVEAKRKLAGIPSLCKAEMAKICDL